MAFEVSAGFVVGAVGSAWLVVVAAVLLHHDHGEVQGRPRFQLWCAATRFQEAARLAGGTFPANRVEVQRLLAPTPGDVLDPWGHPFRHERLGAEGKRARVFSLGKDFRPSGASCDEDIVYWIDASIARQTWDVRQPPEGWSAPWASGPSESPGSR